MIIDVTASAKLGDPGYGQGVAVGDIDNDGDIDLVLGNIGGPPRVFRNEGTVGNHWSSIRVMTGKRDAIGAKVTLVAGGQRFLRVALAGYSYVSNSDLRAHFGLGRRDSIDSLEVVWPGGATETFSSPGVDRAITLHKGRGVQQ